MTPLLLTNPTDFTSSMLVGLLSFAVRATVLLLGAWIATRLLRRASAATRHLIWTVATAGVLTLPLLAVLLPEWKVPVVTIVANADAPAARATPGAAARQESREPSPQIASVPSRSNIQSREQDARSNVMTLTRGFASRVTVEGFITVLWLSVALLLLSRLAIANARVSGWQRSSRPVDDGRWLTLALRLTREYGIERPVMLLENQESDVPVTWGVVYPVILLPAGAEHWDEEQRVAVLTHELAHVKRFDALTQLLAQLALALLWFHPLVWMAVRRMRLEREHACDDFVLVAGARASRYADDLLGLARRLTRPTAPAAAALAMARRSELEGRLLAILDPATKRTAVRRARVGAMTLAVIVLAAPLAAFRPAARVSAAFHPQPAVPRSTDSSSVRLADARESSLPPLGRIRPDTEPVRTVDVQTLIDVTKGAKRMTSDHEKGQLLAVIAQRYVRNDALRDAYLEAVFTMTSDYERSKALIALLERDSIPASSTAQVLRSAALMTSDMNRGMVLKRISPATFADSTVQRAYLDVIVAMTSDVERASAISSLVKQRPLPPSVQLALLRATTAISSNVEKANVLLLFVERQTVADEIVRRAFLKAAETLTSDREYRRVMMAVL
ncbi:MAG: M56 family metallopeptidase [Gemmatimonadaceae bacterium]